MEFLLNYIANKGLIVKPSNLTIVHVEKPPKGFVNGLTKSLYSGKYTSSRNTI